MTIITGRQFRANQGRYIGMAHRGEDVYIKSRSGNVILTPVADDIEGDEEAFQRYVNSPEFLAIAEKARKEMKDGKCITLKTHEDIDKYFESL